MLLATIFCVVAAHGQSFDVDGISYNVITQPTDESPGEVEVTGGEIKEEIAIPETVTYDEKTYTIVSIGRDAFSGRYRSDNFTRKYIIPGTVKTIKYHAFYDNYYLEEVEFNEGLETIGQSAFGYAYQLREIRLPSTVAYIDADAFITNQENSATISCLASTPPNIGSTTFQGRTDATLHVVVSDVDAYKDAEYWKDFSEITGDILYTDRTDRCYAPVFTLDNDLLTMSCKTEGATIYYTIDGSLPDENAIRYTSPISYSTNPIIRAIAIADGKESSAVRNYYDTEYIESIRNVTDEQGISYTLIQSDDGNFFYYSVTGHSDELSADIVIPDEVNGCPVRAIRSNAFYNCSNINSVTIGNAVTQIGSSAFYNCSNISSVTIGKAVTQIEPNAFYGCYNLNVVVVTVKDNFEFCNNDIIGAFRSGSIKLIDNDGIEITEFVIPEGVTSIGEKAFQRCTGLSAITIPNSVTSIGSQAFLKCI